MRLILLIMCLGFWVGAGVVFVYLNSDRVTMKHDRDVIEARAVAAETAAERCDKVVLTCLSQQTVVKYGLESLYAMVRENCK